MSIPQTIIDIAAICKGHGIDQVVLGPGSRSAPLTLAFTRHPGITARVVGDERSAGYIAMGISQSFQRPTILISTSGTAALNFGPAIAEAFYQCVPLLVFTADRPPEWIDQNDGQSIRQSGVFHHHVKKSFQFPVDLEHKDAQWHVHRIVNEAIVTSTTGVPGPVHINVPFREPLYPDSNEGWHYSEQVPVVNYSTPIKSLKTEQWNPILEEWSLARKVMVVGGQGPLSKSLCKALSEFSGHTGVPIIGDVVSNLSAVKGVVQHIELILGANTVVLDSLRPDLLISFNGAIVSKNLKLFLRKHQPSGHWHIQTEHYPSDTFKSLSRIIPMDATTFFTELAMRIPSNSDKDWIGYWQGMDTKAKQTAQSILNDHTYNEFQTVNEIMKHISGTHLHLANSTPVRLADLSGVPSETIEVSANRGTSGIDGCTSTAVGHALVNGRTNVLITGDMAFLYDRNALWHQYKLPNLKIIMLNNHGGGIFRLIDGPRQQPELEEFFVTPQTLSAKNAASDFSLKYLYCNQQQDLSEKLKKLFEPNDHATLLEIEFTQGWKEIYQQLKQSLKEQL